MTPHGKSNSSAYGLNLPLAGAAAPVASAAALLGLNALSANVRMCRTWLDASRNLVRMQQDAAIEFVRNQLGMRDENGQSALTQAMESTSHAYETLGAAWVDAQRTAFEAFSVDGLRH